MTLSLHKKILSVYEESYHSHPCHIIGPDVIRQGTGEHQNPMDTRLRTKEEACYTIKMIVWLYAFTRFCILRFIACFKKQKNLN